MNTFVLAALLLSVVVAGKTIFQKLKGLLSVIDLIEEFHFS